MVALSRSRFARGSFVPGVSPARAEGDLGLSYFSAGQFAEAFQAWQHAADAGDRAGRALSGRAVRHRPRCRAGLRARRLTWYERAAAEGNATAHVQCGSHVRFRPYRPAQPGRLPHEWYAPAAAEGLGRAEYNLALLYESGLGVPRDDGRAVAVVPCRGQPRHLPPRATIWPGLAALCRRGASARRIRAMRDFQLAQRVLLTAWRGRGGKSRRAVPAGGAGRQSARRI